MLDAVIYALIRGNATMHAPTMPMSMTMNGSQSIFFVFVFFNNKNNAAKTITATKATSAANDSAPTNAIINATVKMAVITRMIVFLQQTNNATNSGANNNV